MSPEEWRALRAANDDPAAALPPGAAPFAALIAARHAGRPFAIGQIGQSLDGRIATASGHSHYINGREARAHLHRLRALVDAVIIGVGTALADNPKLTVRAVSGRSPARVVIDPNGRLAGATDLGNGAAPAFRIVRPGASLPPPAGFRDLDVPPGPDGGLDPNRILRKLAEQGLSRVLVEGGARTLSRFLAAGALDRLHILLAPLIIGSGPTGLDLPPIQSLAEAHRPRTTSYTLGPDWLFDVDLS